MKCDGAPELLAIRREVSLLRESPTVPITVPVKCSKSNGAIEKTVQSWQWQFRAMNSHLEDESGGPIEPQHPIWQWCAWWAAGILTRFAIRDSGRIAYEQITGHRTKQPIACFGEVVMWRRARKVSGAGKWDPEYQEGVFVGHVHCRNRLHHWNCRRNRIHPGREKTSRRPTV